MKQFQVTVAKLIMQFSMPESDALRLDTMINDHYPHHGPNGLEIRPDMTAIGMELSNQAYRLGTKLVRYNEFLNMSKGDNSKVHVFEIHGIETVVIWLGYTKKYYMGRLSEMLIQAQHDYCNPSPNSYRGILKRMQELKDSGDPEPAHKEADELIYKFLVLYGYDKLAKSYLQVPK